MKTHRYLSYVFMALPVLLSNVMCAVVSYNYCDMQWGIRYGGYSAPANVAFLSAVPYAAGIAVCAGLAWLFHRRSREIS